MDGSNGKIVELLERIALGVEDNSKRIDETNQHLEMGFASVNARIDKTNERLDNMNDYMSRYHGDHEQRIRALEDRVLPKPGS